MGVKARGVKGEQREGGEGRGICFLRVTIDHKPRTGRQDFFYIFFFVFFQESIEEMVQSLNSVLEMKVAKEALQRQAAESQLAAAEFEKRVLLERLHFAEKMQQLW